MEILITGATGFVGGRLCRQLLRDGHRITALVRKGSTGKLHVGAKRLVHDLSQGPCDATPFDIVIHCAGETTPSAPSIPLEASLNVLLAKNIAASACKRLIVISSVAASIAEHTPQLARRYGFEKLGAELAIRSALPKGIPCVFVRAPAIYGPGVTGPIDRLSRLMAKGVPLPLANARAPRPYISTRNFETFVSTIVNAPIGLWTTAHMTTPEPHDGRLVSTATLCRMMARVQGRRSPRLFYMPQPFVRAFADALGKRDLVTSALDPVPLKNDGHAVTHWGWSPAETMPHTLSYLRE